MQGNQLFDVFTMNLPRLQAAHGDEAVTHRLQQDLIRQAQPFLSPRQIAGMERFLGLTKAQEALDARLKAREAAAAGTKVSGN